MYLYQAKTKPGGCKTSSYCVERIGRFHPIAQKQKNHLNIPFVLAGRRQQAGSRDVKTKAGTATQEISLSRLDHKEGALAGRPGVSWFLGRLGLAEPNRLAVKAKPATTHHTTLTKYNEFSTDINQPLFKISLGF